MRRLSFNHLPRPSRMAGAVAMIATGSLLIAAAVGYLTYRTVVTSQLDRYTVIAIKQDASPSGWAFVAVTPEEGSSSRTALRDRGPSPAQIPDELHTAAYAVPDTLYPAQVINPKYWAAPLWAGSDPFEGPVVPGGFRLVGVPGRGTDQSGEPPVRLVIPAIGLDAPIKQLQIDERDGRLAYEPVKYVVGFIPGTSGPGENGTGWYFGHLESPGYGEGNVFYRLPEVAGMIRNDPVDVFVSTESDTFLYRVTSTEVMPAEQLALTQTGSSTIALVASFPRLVYTHRFVVYAELLATRRDREAQTTR